MKFYKCGCYTINSSGKKIYLKSNIDYHKKHKPKCMYDQRKSVNK